MAISRKDEEPFNERRDSPRNECFTAVAYAAQGFSGMEYVHDLSAWGVFIRTKEAIPVGESISISVPDSGGLISIKIVGEVVRATSHGIGVKFKIGIDDTALKSMIE